MISVSFLWLLTFVFVEVSGWGVRLRFQNALTSVKILLRDTFQKAVSWCVRVILVAYSFITLSTINISLLWVHSLPVDGFICSPSSWQHSQPNHSWHTVVVELRVAPGWRLMALILMFLRCYNPSNLLLYKNLSNFPRPIWLTLEVGCSPLSSFWA